MTNKLAGISLGLALLAGAAAPAAAADWNNGAGSYKDRPGTAAVPVPAPVPVPVYSANWYFRMDIGVGLGTGGPDASENGMLYGLYDSPGATGPEPFGARSSWFSDDYPTFVSGGAGVGYVWSRRFRTDVTVEARTNGRSLAAGEETYIQYENTCGGWCPIDGDADGNPDRQVRTQVRDTTTLSGGFALVNAYYDFERVRGFTPYVGAGVGVAFNQLKRTYQATEAWCQIDDVVPSCPAYNFQNSYSGSRNDHTMSFAAALMAGVAYDVSEYVALDFNYRFLHIEGTSTTMPVTVFESGGSRSTTFNSRFSVGDTQEHQLRAGLRFNIH